MQKQRNLNIAQIKSQNNSQYSGITKVSYFKIFVFVE